MLNIEKNTWKNGNGKNTLKFNEDFIKNYDEDSDKGYIFEVDIEYPKNFYMIKITMLFI